MTSLVVDNRLADPDAAFRLLVEAHRPLSEADSADLNARLVLILANYIGDTAVLAEAIALASASLSRATSAQPAKG